MSYIFEAVLVGYLDHVGARIGFLQLKIVFQRHDFFSRIPGMINLRLFCLTILILFSPTWLQLTRHGQK